jgi:hypothetical protein
MKPNKLIGHQISQHPETINFTRDDFEQILVKRRRNEEVEMEKMNQQSIEASYFGFHLLARRGRPHTDCENLLKPYLLGVSKIFQDEKLNEYEKIPFSARTVKRRIDEMAQYEENELINRLKRAKIFSLQLDETTDIANLAELMVYCRYREMDQIREEMLFCKTLETTTTGRDIFQLLDQYFQDKNLLWENCVSICTDGAPSMTGKNIGFRGFVSTGIFKFTLFEK